MFLPRNVWLTAIEAMLAIDPCKAKGQTSVRTSRKLQFSSPPMNDLVAVNIWLGPLEVELRLTTQDDIVCRMCL